MSVPYYKQNQRSSQRDINDVRRDQVLDKVVLGLFMATVISALIAQIGIPVGFYYLAILVEFSVIIFGFFAKKEETIEILYYIFVGATAVTLGFILGVIANIPGGMQIISTAFASTALIVGGIYAYTYINRPNTLGMRKFLFPALLLLMVVYIVGIFVTYSSTTYLLLSIGGAILFSLYLFYDLGRLMNGHYVSPARMAWMIYWDILLIFKYILNILIMMNRD